MVVAGVAGITTTTVLPDHIWTCTGRYRVVTYQDCQGDDSKRCYFLEHFAQYRPCVQICNDVVVGSIGERNLERIVQGFTHPFLFCTV